MGLFVGNVSLCVPRAVLADNTNLCASPLAKLKMAPELLGKCEGRLTLSVLRHCVGSLECDLAKCGGCWSSRDAC